jgi:hypothetical protein
MDGTRSTRSGLVFTVLWFVSLMFMPSATLGAFSTAMLRDSFGRPKKGPPPSVWWSSGSITMYVGLVVSSNGVTREATSGAGSAWWYVCQFGPDMFVTLDVPDGTATAVDRLSRTPSARAGR